MEQKHSFAIGVQSSSSANDGNPDVNNTQDGNTKDDENIMEAPTIAVGENDDSAATARGINDLWTTVNHIAIVVSDVGASLSFYTDVVGMKQIMRPNFDRHGAWLTMNNVDLHLIKGRPAVHADDDLIVGHIAITVSGEKMNHLRERLTSMGVKFRKNVSVPNPTITKGPNKGRVDQCFVRDPDGYYIEFCSCQYLEDYLTEQMGRSQAIASNYDWSVYELLSTMKAGIKLIESGKKAKAEVLNKSTRPSANHEDGQATELGKLEKPEWMIPDDEDGDKVPAYKITADSEKLANLLKRQKTYGDITQNATASQIERLLVLHNNDVPKVIDSLEEWVLKKGTRTYTPPAFYDRDGTFLQPPSFEMPAYIMKDEKRIFSGTPPTPMTIENGKNLG